jgi:hypothetical protein
MIQEMASDWKFLSNEDGLVSPPTTPVIASSGWMDPTSCHELRMPSLFPALEMEHHHFWDTLVNCTEDEVMSEASYSRGSSQSDDATSASDSAKSGLFLNEKLKEPAKNGEKEELGLPILDDDDDYFLVKEPQLASRRVSFSSYPSPSLSQRSLTNKGFQTNLEATSLTLGSLHLAESSPSHISSFLTSPNHPHPATRSKFFNGPSSLPIRAMNMYADSSPPQGIPLNWVHTPPPTLLSSSPSLPSVTRTLDATVKRSSSTSIRRRATVGRVDYSEFQSLQEAESDEEVSLFEPRSSSSTRRPPRRSALTHQIQSSLESHHEETSSDFDEVLVMPKGTRSFPSPMSSPLSSAISSSLPTSTTSTLSLPKVLIRNPEKPRRPGRPRSSSSPKAVFVCETCHSTFVRRHDLKRHSNIHMGLRPFQCKCGQSFSRQDALHRHLTKKRCTGEQIPSMAEIKKAS